MDKQKSYIAKLALSIVGLIVVMFLSTGILGFSKAQMLDGRYPYSDWITDSIGLLALAVTVKLFYTLLSMLMKRYMQNISFVKQKILVLFIYIFATITITLPLVYTAIQTHPQRVATTETPATYRLNFTEAKFQSAGNTLSGWFIPAQNENAPIVLIIHGVNANKQNFMNAAIAIHEIGLNAFIFDLRAHGDSEGHVTTFGIDEMDDVKAAYDWLKENFPGRPVFALGYSMGGAAVLRAAAEYGIFEKIVVDSTFEDFSNMAKKMTTGNTEPVATVAWQLCRFWSWVWTGTDLGGHNIKEAVEKIADKPLFIIHSKGDRMIPYTEALQLYEDTGKRAEFWLLDDFGHVGNIHHPLYKTRLKNFFMPEPPKQAEQQESQ